MISIPFRGLRHFLQQNEDIIPFRTLALNFNPLSRFTPFSTIAVTKINFQHQSLFQSPFEVYAIFYNKFSLTRRIRRLEISIPFRGLRHFLLDSFKRRSPRLGKQISIPFRGLRHFLLCLSFDRMPYCIL